MMLFRATRVLLVMKTHEDGWYIVTNTYKFFKFGEIFLYYHILVCVRAIPTYRVYQLYEYVGLHVAGTEYQACPRYTMVHS